MPWEQVWAAHDAYEVQAFKTLVKAQEGPAQGGATILTDGSKVSRTGAAFVNCALMSSRNQHDAYRMLTHPGCQVVPAALAVAEGNGCTGKEFAAAVAAGMEVLIRICINPEVIPATHAHGFRAGGLYAVFGSAIAAGKLLGLDEDGLTSTISLANTFACGTVEGVRMWGRGEIACLDPTATRNGVWAALLAQAGFPGVETALEGQGGFYHAFTGKRDWDLSGVTQDLGKHFEFTKITSKQWPQTGYIQTPIWLSSSMAKEHDLKPEEIASVEMEMFYLETTYPTPAFPNRTTTGVNSTEFGIALSLVERGYPQYGDAVGGIATLYATSLEGRNIDHRIPELMQRINIIGTKERAPYFPKMTVTLKNGATYTGEMNGLEAFRYGLKEEQELMKVLAPGLSIPESQFNELITLASEMEKQPNIDRVVQLTVSPR